MTLIQRAITRLVYCFFFFRSGANLKVTDSPLLKRLPFCRSIYVTKVMKLLAFIFEQPSYCCFSLFLKDPLFQII